MGVMAGAAADFRLARQVALGNLLSESGVLEGILMAHAAFLDAVIPVTGPPNGSKWILLERGTI